MMRINDRNGTINIIQVDEHGEDNRRAVIFVKRQCLQVQRRREERRGFIIRLVV